MSQPQQVESVAAVLADWQAEGRRLAEWLASLDHLHDQAPGPVVDRVRGDYRERLAALLDRAVSRADEVREALAAARRRFAAASDGRLELRLRYLIGEVDAAALDAGLDEQEAVIAAAVANEAELSGVLPPLDAFVKDLRTRFPELRGATPAAAGAERAPEGDADDLLFLQALPVSDVETVPPPPPKTEETKSQGRAEPTASLVTISSIMPRALLGCRSCGEGNDPSLWYCDGCGAELT